MIDPALIKKDVMVKVKDGSTLTIKGAYMSDQGVVYTAKPDVRGIYERSVLLTDIVEIIEG